MCQAESLELLRTRSHGVLEVVFSMYADSLYEASVLETGLAAM
jgi:hypothetical protein